METFFVCELSLVYMRWPELVAGVLSDVARSSDVKKLIKFCVWLNGDEYEVRVFGTSRIWEYPAHA